MTQSTNVDVVVLNKNQVSSQKTLEALQKQVSRDFYRPQYISENRFHCFCKRPSFGLSEIKSRKRTSVRKVQFGMHTLFLMFIHGVDSRNYDPEARQKNE